MAAVISVQNLSKNYKDFTAVNGLSFTVNEGDVYGFLGQNGAGKSTTIRMLLTLIKPTSGTIKIFGKNLATHRSEILKQVGAVIEKPDLYKYLSAYQNLRIFAKMSGVKVTREMLMTQLKMVSLEDRAHDKVKTFSQGMKQRLGIAVALVHNPKLIILDEPTNGLDPQGIADIRNLIMRLSKEMGITVVVSSHLLSEIEIIANRIIIINKGKKIVEGQASELLDPAKTILQVETVDNVQSRKKMTTTKWSSSILESDDVLRFQLAKTDIDNLIKVIADFGFEIYSTNKARSIVVENSDSVVLEVETADNSEVRSMIRSSTFDKQLLDTSDVLRLQMNKADIPALVNDMANMNIGVLSVQPRHSLEDYFLSLTTQQPHANPVTN